MIKDPEILFVIMRLDAFISSHLKKPKEAVAKFEAVAEFAANNDFYNELQLAYYDLGYACINDEQTHKAYDYWNKLAELNRNYHGIQGLIMNLRREMSNEINSPFDEKVTEKVAEWLEGAFPQNFLWEICGLKSEKKFNIKNYLFAMKTAYSPDNSSPSDIMHYADDMLSDFSQLDLENFKIISGKVIDKLGYRVNEILNSYKENDGCDFLATEKSTGNKVIVWVRRWKQTKVGEIPLRNFAQAVNDARAAVGLFITTNYLTDSAVSESKNFEKLKLVLPDELNSVLQRLM